MTKGKLGFILLFLIAYTIHPDEIDDGKALQTAGDHRAAYSHFASWLEAHPNDPDFPQVLELLIDSAENIDTAEQFLKSLQEICADRKNKAAVTLKIAFLREMSGDVQGAQQAFELANFSSTDTGQIGNFFHSIRLLIEMGEFERAKAQANAIITTADEERLIGTARLYLAYILYLLEDVPGSSSTLQAAAGGIDIFPPEELMLLFNIAGLLEDGRSAELAKEAMLRNYPKSPEIFQMEGRGKAGTIAGVHILQAMGAKKEEEVSADSDELIRIQTGVFADRNNATAQTKKLENAGIPAVIETFERDGNQMFRVITAGYKEGEVRRKIVELKEIGVEGFLIFP